MAKSAVLTTDFLFSFPNALRQFNITLSKLHVRIMKTKSFEESLKKKFIKQKYNQKKPKRKQYKKIRILDISVSFRSSSARTFDQM